MALKKFPYFSKINPEPSNLFFADQAFVLIKIEQITFTFIVKVIVRFLLYQFWCLAEFHAKPIELERFKKFCSRIK